MYFSQDSVQAHGIWLIGLGVGPPVLEAEAGRTCGRHGSTGPCNGTHWLPSSRRSISTAAPIHFFLRYAPGFSQLTVWSCATCDRATKTSSVASRPSVDGIRDFVHKTPGRKPRLRHARFQTISFTGLGKTCPGRLWRSIDPIAGAQTQSGVVRDGSDVPESFIRDRTPYPNHRPTFQVPPWCVLTIDRSGVRHRSPRSTASGPIPPAEGNLHHQLKAPAPKRGSFTVRNAAWQRILALSAKPLHARRPAWVEAHSADPHAPNFPETNLIRGRPG